MQCLLRATSLGILGNTFTQTLFGRDTPILDLMADLFSLLSEEGGLGLQGWNRNQDDSSKIITENLAQSVIK